MIPPGMDPADSSERFRREVTDKVYRLCDLLLEGHEERFHRAVEKRLKETVSCFPWVLDTLNPIVMDFLLSTLHLHSPPQAAHRPGQLVDSQPETPAPTSTRKRRLRRRRSSPQPNPRTSQEPAVVSSTDNFPFPSLSVFVSAVDELTAQVTSPRSEVPTPLAASPSAAVAPPSFHLPAATILPSFSPPATSPPGPAQPGEPGELALPEQEPGEPGELSLPCVNVSDQRVIDHVPHLAVAHRSSDVATGTVAGRRRSSAATGPVAARQNCSAAAAGPLAVRRSCNVAAIGLETLGL
ncbi:serine/threonine-protein kinase C-like [Simochromis diagramma]|uniref:serine/threonine-protein kinase C-like n=1 Tax=Simochromis diagramma TaxID=43689 RepID=UPI001A7E3247|nr:serine/threonine-protein kinase C-like [Simochromis diagramma]